MFKNRKMKRYLIFAAIAIAALTFNAISLFALPIIGMSLGGKNRTLINVKGGGLAQVRQISPAQVDTWSSLGYLGGTELNDEHSMLELVEEGGTFTNALSGEQKVKINTTLKQTSIDEINLLKNCSGQYFDFYYYVKLANTKIQEISAIPVVIKPGPVLSFKSNTERTIAVTLYLLAPKTTATRAPTAYNVTADVPYVITENASAQGAPTEITTTFATLISNTL